MQNPLAVSCAATRNLVGGDFCKIPRHQKSHAKSHTCSFTLKSYNSKINFLQSTVLSCILLYFVKTVPNMPKKVSNVLQRNEKYKVFVIF